MLVYYGYFFILRTSEYVWQGDKKADHKIFDKKNILLLHTIYLVLKVKANTYQLNKVSNTGDQNTLCLGENHSRF